jgi:NAD+ kinase
MKIALVSKDAAALARCKESAKEHGLDYDGESPDVVLTYGGDGTFLHAERKFPGVPKLPLRKSATCQKCYEHEIEEALTLLSEKKYDEEELIKVEAAFKGERLIGLNDIIIRNKDLEHAMRFDLFVDGKLLFEHLIGDGLVIATPFGSTAYYKSVTREPFEQGIGIALNNTMQEIAPLLLDESCEITVKILRGPAEVAADNLKAAIILDEGDEITITVSEQKARVLRFH